MSSAGTGPDLLERPSVVVGSKADVLTPEDWGDDAPVDLALSAATGDGVQPFLWRLVELVDRARAADDADGVEREQFVIHRPEPVGVAISPRRRWLVAGLGPKQRSGPSPLSDMNDPGALEYAQRRLERLGVNRALRRAGVGDGRNRPHR